MLRISALRSPWSLNRIMNGEIAILWFLRFSVFLKISRLVHEFLWRQFGVACYNDAIIRELEDKCKRKVWTTSFTAKSKSAIWVFFVICKSPSCLGRISYAIEWQVTPPQRRCFCERRGWKRSGWFCLLADAPVIPFGRVLQENCTDYVIRWQKARTTISFHPLRYLGLHKNLTFL